MPKFNSYDNITQPNVAVDDELAIWDTSLSLLKNITADEIRKYILNNPSVVGDLDVAGDIILGVSDTSTLKATDTAGAQIDVIQLDSFDNLQIGDSSGVDFLQVDSLFDQKFNIAGSEGFRVTSTGSKTTGIHEVTEGIKLPAIAVPSADPNTIDDYEKGTWTGTLTAVTTAPTAPPTATGRYTKIGDRFDTTVSFDAADTTGAVGRVLVTGLPAATTHRATGPCWAFNVATTTLAPVVMFPTASSASLNLFETDVGGAANIIAGTSKYLRLSITYFV